MNNLTSEKINSISNLEFINNLDDIFYNLLYSSQNGYINLHSKSAVNDFENYIEKFDWEVSKISDKINSSNIAQIINSKKKEFIAELEKHYEEEVQIWAQEVFDNFIQNILFSAGLNKTNTKYIDMLYERILSAINWLGDFRKFENEDKNILLEKINQEFNDSLRASFSDFMPKQRPNKTNPATFLKALKIYRENFEEFLLIDFQNNFHDISQEDLAYLNILKSKAMSSEKNIKDDEIDLINCALLMLNLKSDNLKYRFIKELLKDFDNFTMQNKKITEDDKISLTKRRLELFKDSLSSKQEYRYFKKKLISLNE